MPSLVEGKDDAMSSGVDTEVAYCTSRKKCAGIYSSRSLSQVLMSATRERLRHANRSACLHNLCLLPVVSPIVAGISRHHCGAPHQQVLPQHQLQWTVFLATTTVLSLSPSFPLLPRLRPRHLLGGSAVTVRLDFARMRRRRA